MERLQGPINHSSLFGEHFDHQVEWLGRFEDDIEDKMPFLQMLQSVDQSQTTTTTTNPPFCWGLREPSFQTLLKLQHSTKNSPLWESDTNFDLSHHEIMESESCVDYVDDGSPAKPHEAMVVPHQDQSALVDHHEDKGKAKQGLTLTKERRKRKRARAVKNKEEVESQRMTHIAVERNRRRQMNDHLNVLRSLMPSSYIQRGDQASIVGGAIDFVKELEQLLQSLEAQKRMRKPREEISSNSVLSQSSSSSSSSSSTSSSIRDVGDEVRAENKSEIEATVIQTHVNLKVRCSKRPGQLLEAIVALEDLRLSVLHLNATSSSDDTILYSFNLKIEDDCQLGSADEIAGEVHRIFGIIDQQS